MNNRGIIEKFYKAFQNKNGKEMSECYMSRQIKQVDFYSLHQKLL